MMRKGLLKTVTPYLKSMFTEKLPVDKPAAT